MYAAGDVRVEDREKPTIEKPTDAIIKSAASCVCGSDLWPYRGVDEVRVRRRWGTSTSAGSTRSAPR